MEKFYNIIIYEDNHILVINKPAGVLAQKDSSGDLDILTWAKSYIKYRDKKPGNVFLALIHRLDRNTAGIMVLAKTSKAASRLSEQIRKKQWIKGYMSLSISNNNHSLDNDWQVWFDYLSKNRQKNISHTKNLKIKKNNSVNKIHIDEKNYKESLLKTRLIAQKHIDKNIINLRIYELITGRSHQIRVQLSNRGEHILGDIKYGAKPIQDINKYFLGLFAYKLTIIHPIKKNHITFTALPIMDSYWGYFDEEIKNILN